MGKQDTGEKHWVINKGGEKGQRDIGEKPYIIATSWKMGRKLNKIIKIKQESYTTHQIRNSFIFD